MAKYGIEGFTNRRWNDTEVDVKNNENDGEACGARCIGYQLVVRKDRKDTRKDIGIVWIVVKY